MMKNMNRITYLLIAVSLLFVSCDNTTSYKKDLQINNKNLEPQSLVVKSYNEALFSIDTHNFVNELKLIQKEYPAFLNGDLDDPEVIDYIRNFVTDTFCVRLNMMVENRFSDKNSLDKEIRDVYQRFKYYYPDIQLAQPYYYVSGVDYQTPPIVLTNDIVAISLDYYLGTNDNIYDYLGMPRFRSARCHPSYITRDLAQSIYHYYVEKNHTQKDVLTEMIYMGKMNFFVEAMNPSLPDSVLLGYTAKQMSWVETYEGDIWASIIGNNLLYAKGLDSYRNLFGDGPFTQAYSNEAPARLGEYIGLQIIRSYMTHNDVTLQELMNNNDIQQIFQYSQYKPRKK